MIILASARIKVRTVQLLCTADTRHLLHFRVFLDALFGQARLCTKKIQQKKLEMFLPKNILNCNLDVFCDDKMKPDGDWSHLSFYTINYRRE